MTTRKSQQHDGHPCIKEEEFGHIKERLASQQETDKKIEEAISKLVENHEAEKSEHNKQFASITAEISKVGAALQLSAENNKQLLQNQTELLKQISDVAIKSVEIQTNQTNIERELKEHIVHSATEKDKQNEWAEKINDRLVELEKNKASVMMLTSFIAGLAACIGWAVDIFLRYVGK